MHHPTWEHANVSETPPVRHRLTRRRRLLFVGIYAVYVVGLAGLSAMLFWAWKFDIPLASKPDVSAVWRYYYPEVWDSGVMDADIDVNDDHFDVLLLGGSVLDQVSAFLENDLRRRFPKRLRLYQLAVAAHTSRDSLLKYRLLSDKPFDLIVFYHGINDARMNCCEPTLFKDDYTHCHWYNRMQRRVAAGTVSFSDYLGEQIQQLIPLGEPKAELMEFGSAIKTETTFRQNLEEILVATAENNQPVLLMTFASFFPEDYSKERFLRGELSYGPGEGLPAEIWGKPGNVKAAIEAHNTIIRDAAHRHDHVIFLDMKKHFAGQSKLFTDPCHFTREGCDLFVQKTLSDVELFAARGGDD